MRRAEIDYACAVYRYERHHRRCDRIVLLMAVIVIPMILLGVL